MHPIFLDLGFLKIHWYGVMAALAAMTAFYVLVLNRKYAKMSKDQAADIIFYCVLVGGVIGARIFYVVLNWPSFAADPWPAVIRSMTKDIPAAPSGQMRLSTLMPHPAEL